MQETPSDALISFCLASLALSKGYQDECERLTNRAVEHMVATRSGSAFSNFIAWTTLSNGVASTQAIISPKPRPVWHYLGFTIDPQGNRYL